MTLCEICPPSMCPASAYVHAESFAVPYNTNVGRSPTCDLEAVPCRDFMRQGFRERRVSVPIYRRSGNLHDIALSRPVDKFGHEDKADGARVQASMQYWRNLTRRARLSGKWAKVQMPGTAAGRCQQPRQCHLIPAFAERHKAFSR